MEPNEPNQADRKPLLAQLRIERDESPPPRPRRPLIGFAIGGGVALVAGLGAWQLAGRGDAAAIPTAVAAAGSPAATPVVATPRVRDSLLDASGYVVARRRATVSSKITGKVVEVCVEEGERVTEGAVIARLDDSNGRAVLNQAIAQAEHSEASLRAAQMALEDARPVFERSMKQMQAGIISQQGFDTERATFNRAKNVVMVAERALAAANADLAVARRNLDDTVVRAPFSGILTEQAAQRGEIVSPVSGGGGFTRTGIGTIVDMDSLEVEVDVSENFINRVSSGQPVSIALNAYPEWRLPGRVIASIPVADRTKATIKVRIAIGERDPRIIPDMGARVTFMAPQGEAAAAVATKGSATEGA